MWAMSPCSGEIRARSVITTPSSRVTGSIPPSRPSTVSVKASAISAPCPSRAPSARRRSASRESRLWASFASSAGRWALTVAMPCSPGVKFTWRFLRADSWRSRAPCGSSSPMTVATSFRHRLTPAPSMRGIRSKSISSAWRRCRSSSGSTAEAVAYATGEVTFPRASDVSMRGMEPTRRRADARLLEATEGERRVARERSRAVFASAVLMSRSSGGRSASSWPTSSRAALT